MRPRFFLMTYFIALIILNSCDLVDDRLVVINHRNKPIAFQFSQDSSLIETNLWQFYIENQIKPGASKNIALRGLWTNYIKSSKSHRVYFFFFDIDTLSKYKDMDHIVKHKLYLSKIGLTESELESNDWNIKYQNENY